MRLFKTLLGSGFYFFWVLFGFTYNGGHFASLLQPGEFIMVLFAPVGALIGAYGFRGAARLIRASFSARKQTALAIPHAKLERFLSLWIVAVYATAVLSFVLGVIVMMGFIAGPIEKIGEKIAVASVSFFWAVLLAEGFLRPLKRRIVEEELAVK